MATFNDSRSSAAVAPRRLAIALPFDPVLLLATIGIAVCSLIVINGATSTDIPGNPHYYVTRQAIYFGVGFVLMALLSRIDITRLRELKYAFYGFLILSILAVMAVGTTAKGAQRAIPLPFFQYQASELGKLLLILSLAAFVVDRARRMGERDTTARVMIVMLVPAMLVIAQPDLGSGLVYIVIALALLFVAGTSWRHFAGLGVLGTVAIVAVLVAAPAVGVQVLKPYQKDRLTAFLSPTTPPSRATSRSSRRSPSAPARRPGAATRRPRRNSTSSRSTTRTSSSPWSESATASSAVRSCSRSMRCSSGARCGSSPWRRTCSRRSSPAASSRC